jgi:DNA polymerase sigma
MRYLARKLREIGMDQVEAVNDAAVPICKSRDPKYNIYCDINTINLLGIENTRLIIQYIHLDARVEPFLFTLKLFIKSKEINNCKYSVSAAI